MALCSPASFSAAAFAPATASASAASRRRRNSCIAAEAPPPPPWARMAWSSGSPEQVVTFVDGANPASFSLAADARPQATLTACRRTWIGVGADRLRAAAAGSARGSRRRRTEARRRGASSGLPQAHRPSSSTPRARVERRRVTSHVDSSARPRACLHPAEQAATRPRGRRAHDEARDAWWMRQRRGPAAACRRRRGAAAGTAAGLRNATRPSIRRRGWRLPASRRRARRTTGERPCRRVAASSRRRPSRSSARTPRRRRGPCGCRPLRERAERRTARRLRIPLARHQLLARRDARSRTRAQIGGACLWLRRAARRLRLTAVAAAAPNAGERARSADG